MGFLFDTLWSSIVAGQVFAEADCRISLMSGNPVDIVAEVFPSLPGLFYFPSLPEEYCVSIAREWGHAIHVSVCTNDSCTGLIHGFCRLARA